MGNGAANYPSSAFGVQGGSRSEPPRPRPSSPAPSTISPSDSISVRGVETASSKQTRPGVNNGNFKRPQNGYSRPSAPKPVVASRQTPQVSRQREESSFSWDPEFYDMQDQYEPSYFAPDPLPSVSGTSQTSFRTPSASTRAPSSSRSIQSRSNEQAAPSQCSASTASNSQYPSSSSRSSMPGNLRRTTAPSTATVTNQQSFEGPRSGTSRAASTSVGGSSTGSSRQSRAVAHSGGMPQQSAGSQYPQGISIGVPPNAQMHFHYNQVDNRQLHISNVSIKSSLLTIPQIQHFRLRSRQLTPTRTPLKTLQPTTTRCTTQTTPIITTPMLRRRTHTTPPRPMWEIHTPMSPSKPPRFTSRRPQAAMDSDKTPARRASRWPSATGSTRRSSRCRSTTGRTSERSRTRRFRMTAPARCGGVMRNTAFVWLTEGRSIRISAPTTAAATSGRTSVPARSTREACIVPAMVELEFGV